MDVFSAVAALEVVAVDVVDDETSLQPQPGGTGSVPVTPAGLAVPWGAVVVWAMPVTASGNKAKATAMDKRRAADLITAVVSFFFKARVALT